MRVSTAQFYQQSALQMSRKTSDVNEQMAYLSSGKQVLTAKDDAVQYGTLLGYKESLANIDKYQRNITQAEGHNSLQETVFADAEKILDKIKQDMLLANNGRMSTEDLQSLAKQTKNSFSQLLDLANSQNANGDFIFSGFQTEQKPFSQQVDGSVNYSGDTGINELQIAKNITLETNQTGDAAFIKVPNALGDFGVSYPTTPSNTSGVAVATTKITDRSTYNDNTSTGPYKFSTDSTTNNLTVTNSANTVVFPVLPAVPAPFTAGDTISFDGIEVTLSGNPLPGESFTLTEQKDVSIFKTINDAITWMDKGTISVDEKQHQVDYGGILDQLNSAMTHITSRRVDSGIRLQVIESQKDRHLDAELNLTKGRAAIEDLDFAKAVSEFEQSQIALQASQQTFTKIQNLSLFNII